MSKVTSKGQITIPIEVRKALGLEVGDTILFGKIDGNIVIKKNKKDTLVSVLKEAGALGEETRKALDKIRDKWR
ncbi:MAG: AbrB/MazE/SpoVT family DNA-binding domain-containing protein [Thermoplasmatales archaeon]|nr:AbrB/MazE/SpoVT family DNA-binding domain-containing protein [Thermoplasmatales archaeon]MCW6170371.1 AbrB/MazE/SpoVT family DNA-binding domain-containing protein [Thermoplasmatales archaeon]